MQEVLWGAPRGWGLAWTTPHQLCASRKSKDSVCRVFHFIFLSPKKAAAPIISSLQMRKPKIREFKGLAQVPTDVGGRPAHAPKRLSFPPPTLPPLEMLAFPLL